MIHMHCERHLNLIADALPKEYALTLRKCHPANKKGRVNMRPEFFGLRPQFYNTRRC